MTIGDKIKAALHMDKDKSGTGSQTGHTSKPTGAEAGETGPGAYQPMTSGVEHGTSSGTGTGSGTGTTGTADNVGHNESGLSNNPAGGVSSSQGQGATGGTSSGTTAGGAASGGGDGISHFKQGYKEGEPGYSEGYRSGDPLYKDSVQLGKDGEYNESFSASADNKEWAQARELTLAAEREAASAQLSGKKASKELLAAEKAEKALRDAQIKHREALEEAEKYRRQMADTNLKEQDLADAEELYNARRNAASQAENAMKAAESDLGNRQRELDEFNRKVDSHGQHLPQLEDELAARQRDRAAAEDQSAQLLAAAKQAEGNKNALLAEIENAGRAQEEAERLAAIKQQEYMDARNAAQNAAARADELRSKQRALDDEVLGARNRAEESQHNLPALKEAEARAAAELEDSQNEWYRLKELEEEYGRNYTSAHNQYKNAHSKYGPASKELQASQSLLKAREDDLANARNRASKAEGKYRDLLNLADRHKKYGDTAAEAAQAHGQKYEALKREAELHGDKHAEYWHAARQHGDQGSSTATDTIHKLEDKIRNLTHSEGNPTINEA